jgi:hypothetical protein
LVYASLQFLLNIKHNSIKRLCYHPEKGFFHARDVNDQRYLLLDNQVPLNIPGWTDSLIDAFLRQFDTQFKTRCFCGSFMDAIWTNPIPPGHHMVLALPTQTHQHTDLSTTDEGENNPSQKVVTPGT